MVFVKVDYCLCTKTRMVFIPQMHTGHFSIERRACTTECKISMLCH